MLFACPKYNITHTKMRYDKNKGATLISVLFMIFLLLLGDDNDDLQPSPEEQIRITVEEVCWHNEHIIVPGNTIIQEKHGGRCYILTSREERGIYKKVTLGQMLENGIEVLEGLQAGDKIIVAEKPLDRRTNIEFVR